MQTKTQPTRSKSADSLLRDKVLELWPSSSVKTTTPVERKFPPALVGTLAEALHTNRGRVYRWLADPERHRLDWEELQVVAAEVGGSVRVLFSLKHS
jgi:hypothetical protein